MTFDFYAEGLTDPARLSLHVNNYGGEWHLMGGRLCEGLIKGLAT